MFCQAFSNATEFSVAIHKPLPARHSTCAASTVTMQNPTLGESELRFDPDRSNEPVLSHSLRPTFPQKRGH